MRRILIWGYHPNSNSGLGRVTRSFMKAFYDLKEAFTVLVYDGQNFGDAPGLMPYHPKIENNIFNQIKGLDVDLMITIGDIWRCDFPLKIAKYTTIPWIAYTSVEGNTYPLTFRPNDKEIKYTKDYFSVCSEVWLYHENAQKIFDKTFENKYTTRYIHHCVDYKTIRKALPFPLKKLFNIKDSEQLILFVGDNNRRKGINYLLSQISLLPNTALYLHTQAFKKDGVDIHEFKKQHPNIKIYTIEDFYYRTGFKECPDELLYSIYKGSDLFFHPHRAEGFGFCPLEALCAKVNTLASDCGGPSIYLPNNCKIPIKSHTFDSFGGVSYSVSEPDLSKIQWTEWGNHNFSDYEKFSYNSFKNNLKELLDNDFKSQTWEYL